MPEDEAAQFAHMLEVRRQIEAQAAAAQRKVLSRPNVAAKGSVAERWHLCFQLEDCECGVAHAGWGLRSALCCGHHSAWCRVSERTGQNRHHMSSGGKV